jgi:hypothetical protein
MQTISKMLVGAVLTCLLLSCALGSQRPLRHAHRASRERRGVLAQLRRCRGGNPVHHPVRPCKNAVLPPDDDDDNVDPKHPYFKNSYERLPALCHDPVHPFSASLFGSRPVPTEVPRHQTLCILLI